MTDHEKDREAVEWLQALVAGLGALTDRGHVRLNRIDHRDLAKALLALAREALAMRERGVVAKEAVLAAVEAEEELPGSMPEEMWLAIRDDRDAVEEALRVAVRLTKEGILSRIIPLYAGEPVEVDDE